MSKATRPKGVRAKLILGFQHPVPKRGTLPERAAGFAATERLMVVERERALQMAQSLMRRALELLDMVDEPAPAVHLQHAIDVLTNAPIPRTIEEAEAQLDTPEARAIQDRWNCGTGELGHDG